MQTLQEQILNFKSKFSQLVSADKIVTIETALREQKLNRGLDGISKVGDRVTDFTVRDIAGAFVTLSELVKAGPVVLKFYRGGWCPYCNLELMAYQHLVPEFTQAHTTVVALSPEVLEEATKTADSNGLSFPVATDEDLAIAKSLGLVFELDQALRDLYTEFRHPLSQKNTKGLWELPVPATYVIDQDLRIRYASVNLDYRERTDPREVLEFVRREAL